MKVKKVLELLDVIEDVPSDIRDIIYPEDTDMQMEGAYFSDSQNRYIPVRDMDVVHLLRSFKKLNEDAYINKQTPTKIGETYYG